MQPFVVGDILFYIVLSESLFIILSVNFPFHNASYQIRISIPDNILFYHYIFYYVNASLDMCLNHFSLIQKLIRISHT